MIKSIEYPFTSDKIRALAAGDQALVSGRVFTGRDRLHRYLAQGGRVSVPLRDGCIYHCGPVVLCQKGEWIVRAAGPTTSMREEPYMASIIKSHGVRVVVGKGGMGDATRDACRRHGCVYLQTVGGAAAVLAGCIERVSGVYLMDEFGATEGLWDLQVRNLPVVVSIDANGRSVHHRVEAESKRALEQLLNGNGRR